MAEDDLSAEMARGTEEVITRFLACMSDLHGSVEDLARTLVDALLPVTTPAGDMEKMRANLVRVCVGLYDQAVKQMEVWAADFRLRQAEAIAPFLAGRATAQTTDLEQ